MPTFQQNAHCIQGGVATLGRIDAITRVEFGETGTRAVVSVQTVGSPVARSILQARSKLDWRRQTKLY